MTTTTKLVYGTRQGYDNALKRHRDNGWFLLEEEVKPRGTATKKLVFIAYLGR